jgi:DNA-binding transcriptional LysR family regulator
MGRLNQLHPGLRLKAVLAPWQELPERARARDVDLVVLELSQVQDMDDFAVQALAEHPMLNVCRPDHPLTRHPAPTLADVFAYPSAGPTVTDAQRHALLSQLPTTVQDPLRKRGLLAMECDLASTIKDILLHSDATALMPTFVVRRELELGVLAALPRMDLGLRVRFGCAWLRARTVSPIAARFMELLQAHDRDLVAHSPTMP